MNAQAVFPDLKGFNIPASSSWGKGEEEAVEELVELQKEYDQTLDRLGEIESEIEDLKHEEMELEDREVELADEIKDLRRSNPRAAAMMTPGFSTLNDGFPRSFACTECLWSACDETGSAEFRAEEHAHSTSHKVALVLPGGSRFFEQDRIDLEVLPWQ